VLEIRRVATTGVPFFASIGEFFTLGRARATVRRYAPMQRERVAAHRAAGDLRARAARECGDPVSSAILYREALFAYARADLAAQPRKAGASGGGDADRPPGVDVLAPRVPAVPLATVDPSPDDVARVNRAMRATDPLYFDALADDEMNRLLAAFGRVVAVARRRVETRSLLHLRVSRLGRIAGCIFLFLVAAVHIGRAQLHPNLALGKTVAISSFFGGKPEALVDGDIGTSYAVATAKQENAWLAVDLGAPYAVTSVVVRNRVDGWFDDSLPLLLETSIDGEHWNAVGRRDTTFSASAPWTVRLDRSPVRFVRVHSLTLTCLALTEIEVY
jgi:hypothetical protein